jgi:ribosome-associated toxin RatA of RatAB toxin-antitoxin module
MRVVDRLLMKSPAERVFRAAMNVEQWPTLLSHYRWVRMLDRRADGGLVEMSAWRPFGVLKYPTWWVSEMWIEPGEGVIRYQHVRGITAGMDVVWKVHPVKGGTDVTIVHEWPGPEWPLLGPMAASLIIGPVFISGIASRTLAGIARYVERQ